MIALDSKIIISADVIFHPMDGETVLLDLNSGKYYGLDKIGTQIWSLLKEYGSPAAVLEQMRGRYSVDEAVLCTELLTLIERLAEKGLVRVEPAAPGDEI